MTQLILILILLLLIVTVGWISCKNYNESTQICGHHQIMSKEGMQSSTFSAIWFSIELICYNYPNRPTKDHKKKYRKFLESIGDVLPCKFCRDNYKQNLKDYGFSNDIFCCRDTLTKWIYNLHNHVNLTLGKPIYKTYEEVRDYYEQFRANCSNKTNMNIKGCVDPLYKKKKCIVIAQDQ